MQVAGLHRAYPSATLDKVIFFCNYDYNTFCIFVNNSFYSDKGSCLIIKSMNRPAKNTIEE
jgi:hypothetical protein